MTRGFSIESCRNLGEGYLFIPSSFQKPKFRGQAQHRDSRQGQLVRHAVCEAGQVPSRAKHSPLEDLFRLLLGYLDPQVPQGLHDLLRVDSPCNNRAVSGSRAHGGQPLLRRRRSPSFFLSKLLNTSLSFFS